MKKDTLSEKHYEVLNAIPKKQKNAIKQKDLCRKVGLTPRALKEYVTDLRPEYPIVAKQTDGGGYWIAENLVDIRRYLIMIENRRKGYQRTEEIMKKYIYSQERTNI